MYYQRNRIATQTLSMFFFIPCLSLWVWTSNALSPLSQHHQWEKTWIFLEEKDISDHFPGKNSPAEIGWKALGNLISTRTDLCNQSFNERHTSWKEFFLILILSMSYIILDSEEYIRYEEGFYIFQLWRIKHFKIFL